MVHSALLTFTFFSSFDNHIVQYNNHIYSYPKEGGEAMQFYGPFFINVSILMLEKSV